MQSRTTRRFWRLFCALPDDIHRDAKRAYRLFQGNPAHPGLQFKKLEGEDHIYSARIGLEYFAGEAFRGAAPLSALSDSAVATHATAIASVVRAPFHNSK
jgi:hypothetical protein